MENSFLDPAVNPSLISQREKAFKMIKKYGREEAIRIAQEFVDNYDKLIEDLTYYDEFRIREWIKQRIFWSEIKIIIEKWD